MMDRRGESAHFTASVPEIHPTIEMKRIKEAQRVPPVKVGPQLSWRPHGVAMAPDAEGLEKGAEWEISTPHKFETRTVRDLLLKINYVGDTARLSVNGNLLDDNFYNGLQWTVGLHRFQQKIGDAQMRLTIVPLRRDAPIFLEKSVEVEKGLRINPGAKDQTVALRGVTLVPKYRFELTADPSAP